MSKESQMAGVRSQIASTQQERDGYEAKAKEVKKIYNELKSLKSGFVTNKNSLNSKKNEESSSWTGNLRKEKFAAPVEDLSSDFDTTISAIDTNLDRLNDKINEYENKMFELDGLLGQLSILLNNISSAFEKFFN